MKRAASVLVALGLGLAGPATGQELPPQVPPALELPATPAEATREAQPLVESTDPAPAPAPSTEQTVVLDPTAPAKTRVDLDRRTHVGAGIGFSGPIGAAGSLRIMTGLGADVRDGSTRVKAVCAAPLPHCAQGLLLQVDAGSGGGKLSLGVGVHAKIDEETFRGTAGAAFRIALARTWGNPIGTDPDLTYLGTELDISVLRINLTTGVLFRIDGNHGASVLFSWGLGFGL